LLDLSFYLFISLMVIGSVNGCCTYRPSASVKLRENMRASQRNWTLASQEVTGEDVRRLQRKVEKYQAMRMAHGISLL
uniref:Uncharacterized protein n=1 Tax=Aegilops tauschii subsp. strangulata TaxID=200361 RepID=A0A453C3K3_AEGTS